MCNTSVNMWRVLCLLFCLVAGSRQLTITEFGVPTAMPAGENAELQCRYTLKAGEKEDMLIVKWWWTPLNSDLDKKKQLYQRINGQDPELSPEHNHTVNHIEIKENDAIVLLNLEPKHSGTYECEVSDQKDLSEDRKHEELIVYSQGSGPHLNLSLITDTGNDTDDDSEDDILVTCEASDVAPEPELSITINGDTTEELNITEPVSDSSDGLYYVQATVVLSQAKAEGAEIRCEIFFKANFSHPAYVDAQTYIADSSCHLSSSLLLLIAAVFATYMKTLVFTT